MATRQSLQSVFEDIVKWSVQVSNSKSKRKYTPSFITSDKWVEFHGLKEAEKLDKMSREKRKRKSHKKEWKKEADKNRAKTLKKKKPLKTNWFR